MEGSAGVFYREACLEGKRREEGLIRVGGGGVGERIVGATGTTGSIERKKKKLRILKII